MIYGRTIWDILFIGGDVERRLMFFLDTDYTDFTVVIKKIRVIRVIRV